MPGRFKSPAIRLAKKKGVTRTDEFERIVALPTRIPDGTYLVEDMTARLKTRNGEQVLKPEQALGLHEIQEYGGGAILLLPGSGKTHIGLLCFTLLDAIRPLYLCQSSAIHDLKKSMSTIKKHWKMHHDITVLGFGKLQTKAGKEFMKVHRPDVIVVDEAHLMRNTDAARGSRLFDYLDENPDTILVIMTGSPMNSELVECSHLFAFALGDMTPIPVDKDDVDVWSAALDAETQEHDRPPPGVLRAFMDLLPAEERTGDELDQLRRAFKLRMSMTPGVIMNMKRERTRTLRIRSPALVVPDSVKERFAFVHAAGQVDEDEDMFVDEMEKVAALKQLICGFYYRRVWPNGVKNRPWIDACKGWKKFVRDVLKEKPSRREILANEWRENDTRWKLKLGLDSEGYIADACMAQMAYKMAVAEGNTLAEELEGVLRIDSSLFEAWYAVKDEYRVVTEPVWIDEYMIDFAVQWLNDTGGLVWVPYIAVGTALEERGVKFFGGGPQASKDIISYHGPAAASLIAHGTAKNLQQWNRALFLSPPSRGQTWEQGLARLDRDGQLAPIVDIDVLLLCEPTVKSWEKALRQAAFAHAAIDQQRLMEARLEIPEHEDLIVDDSPLWI